MIERSRIAGSAGDTLVKATGVTVSRIRENCAIPVLRNIEFSIEIDDFVSIVGPNGSGKTTLLRALADALDEDESLATGRIEYNTTLWEHTFRRRFGLVHQKPTLVPWLSVKENVFFGPRCRGWSRRKREERFLWLDQLFRIKDLATRLPHNLSGGERQRVALAQAVAIEPKLLLLDEPLSEADPNARAELRSALMRLNSENGVSVVMVTHDVGEAVSLGRRIVVLSPGIALGSGIIAELSVDRSTDLGPLENVRVQRAIASLFANVRDEQLQQDKALDFEATLQPGDLAIIVAVEPEREYESPDSNPFFRIVSDNLMRGVRYRYVFPDFYGRLRKNVLSVEAPPNIQELIASLRARTQLSSTMLERLVEIYIAPRDEVLQISGDCVIVQREGRPLIGWYFPVALNYAFLFKFSEQRLEGTWRLVQSWMDSRRTAVKVFPLDIPRASSGRGTDNCEQN